MTIVFDHAVRVDTQSRHPLRVLLQTREDPHAGRLDPAEERFAGSRMPMRLKRAIEQAPSTSCGSIESTPGVCSATTALISDLLT